MKKITSRDYHDYVIKDGQFIGAFEEMYKNVDDPWHLGEATAIQYDIALYLIRRYGIGGSASIFDIGCGKGEFTARLKRHLPDTNILAVDISTTAIEKARQKFDNLDIVFKVMDIQKEYNKIREKYDLIIMAGVVWYILPDFKDIISYLGDKTLKEEGYFMITNQPFYKPEEQKYGNEIMTCVEDMLKLVDMKVVEMVELNRLTNHTVTVLFHK